MLDMTEKKGHRGQVIVMYISVCVLSVYFRVPSEICF